MSDQLPMTIDDVIAEFRHTETLPRAAIGWALHNWVVAAPRFLELLSRYTGGTDRSEQPNAVLLFIVRLLAEKAETGAFRNLCRLLLVPEPAPFLIGDATTPTLSQMLISTFDGDADLLRSVVEAADADEFVRHAAITAIAYLTRIGSIPEVDTRAWLRHLVTAMHPQEKCFVWIGWIESVAALGFADLTPDAQLLFERGLITSVSLTFAEFQAELQQTLDDPDGMALFAAKKLAPFTGTIDELAGWYNDSAAEESVDAGADRQVAFPRQEWPSGGGDRNPWRHVGRNDPCPCGSSRKFKKCCLGKSEVDRPVAGAALGA